MANKITLHRISNLLSHRISCNIINACVEMDKLLSKQKNKFFKYAKGKVLEIGAGTGLNRKYIKSKCYLALEPRVDFHNKLKKITSKIIHASAEKIPLPSQSVDSVICSMTLCSVKDINQVLSEVYRVLKPKGEFIILEHVAAPTGTWLHFWQKLLKPVFKIFDNGCQIDRDIAKAIHNSKFHLLSWEEFDLTIRCPFVRNWFVARLVK